MFIFIELLTGHRHVLNSSSIESISPLDLNSWQISARSPSVPLVISAAEANRIFRLLDVKYPE